MSLFGMWREETVSKRNLPGCRAQGIMGRPPCSSLSCCSQTAQSFRVTLLCYQSMNLSFISPTYFWASAAVSAPYCLPVNLLCLCFHRRVTEALSKQERSTDCFSLFHWAVTFWLRLLFLPLDTVVFAGFFYFPLYVGQCKSSPCIYLHPSFSLPPLDCTVNTKQYKSTY